MERLHLLGLKFELLEHGLHQVLLDLLHTLHKLVDALHVLHLLFFAHQLASLFEMCIEVFVVPPEAVLDCSSLDVQKVFQQHVAVAFVS